MCLQVRNTTVCSSGVRCVAAWAAPEWLFGEGGRKCGKIRLERRASTQKYIVPPFFPRLLFLSIPKCGKNQVVDASHVESVHYTQARRPFWRSLYFYRVSLVKGAQHESLYCLKRRCWKIRRHHRCRQPARHETMKVYTYYT